MDKPSKRFKTKEKAQMEVYGHVGILEAYMSNLSETGAFLELSQGDYIPRKGDLLSLTIQLDSLNKAHHLAAEVIWCEGVGLGICFIQRDEILERMMAKVSTF